MDYLIVALPLVYNCTGFGVLIKVPRRRKLILVLPLFAAACGGGSPTAPTASTPIVQVSLAGTWSGQGSDSSGPGQMTWVLSQSGTTVSGSVMAFTSAGTVVFTGSLMGALS